jgi:hypothetical protein
MPVPWDSWDRLFFSYNSQLYLMVSFRKSYPFINHLIFSAALGFFVLVNGHSQTLKILPMGNSITWGTNVSPDPDAATHTAYRYKLYQLLGQGGYSVDFIGSRSTGYSIFSESQHCGIPGISDDHLASILETGFNPHWSYNYYETAGPYLNFYPPDIILLEIGTNDVMAGDVYDISPELTRIFNAIDAYETSSGKPIVVFVAKIISTANVSGACNTDALINTYNSNLTSIVNSRISSGDKLVLVDLQCGAGINYATDMLDTYHPNPTGYEKIGQAWYTAINSYNSAPVITDIPNQTKAEGTAFATISLDNYISDNETSDNGISWSISPSSPQYLNVSISNRVATITPKNANWNGSETITFIANDNGYVVQGLRKIVSDAATFTITPVNDAPEILSQAVSLSVNEDSYIDLSLSHLNVQDVDNDISDLSLITASGTNYTFIGNRINPKANYNGNIKVNVTVSDGLLQSSVFQVSVDVIAVNDPPYIILPENRKAYENSLYSETLQVQDIDGSDVLTLTPVTKPSWMNYSSSTHTLYGTPGSANIGNHLVTMRASDGKATTDSSFYITVSNVNHPPVISSIPPENADDYELYSYTIVASDPDDDDITFIPMVIPDWATFNQSTGNLSGTPRYFDTGTFEVSIEAYDGYEDTIQSFSIVVGNTNSNPYFVSSPDTVVHVNDQYSYSIEVSDPDEDDEISFSVVSIPSWMTYIEKAGILIGRPGEANLGKSLVALEVTDGMDAVQQIYYIRVSSPEALHEITTDEKITVYPNPARSSFTVFSSDEEIICIEIFNINGDRVYNNAIKNGSREIQIDDPSILPGIYFYHVFTTSALYNGKIIIE